MGAVILEGLGQMLAPQHGQVGFRRGAQIFQRVQIAEGVFGHQRLAVDAHAADGLGHPGGVAAEQLVVLRRAQVAHQPQLDDELVHQLLGAGLVQQAVVQITLDVDVQEGGGAAQRGGRAVVLLDAGQVAHVQGLHRLLRGLGGLGDVHAVARGHAGHLFQRPDLHADVLAQADALVVHGAVDAVQVGQLVLDQPVGAVQRHPAVVADDAAAAVGVRCAAAGRRRRPHRPWCTGRRGGRRAPAWGKRRTRPRCGSCGTRRNAAQCPGPACSRRLPGFAWPCARRRKG